jgi:predicted ribosomally synthesized peptide with nif11-like leader
MAQEEVVRLFREAQSNPMLKAQVNAAPDLEAFVSLARELGYDFTLEEWKAATGFQVEEFESELSEIPGI